jgi:hypothetical protein
MVLNEGSGCLSRFSCVWTPIGFFVAAMAVRQVQAETMILYLIAFVASAAAATMITGWVIDHECWTQPSHIGFDGAKLDTAPQDHYVHCLLLKRCKDSGFFLRDNITGTLANVGSLDCRRQRQNDQCREGHLLTKRNKFSE